MEVMVASSSDASLEVRMSTRKCGFAGLAVAFDDAAMIIDDLGDQREHRVMPLVLVVMNGSNRCGSRSAGTPGPLSCTQTQRQRDLPRGFLRPKGGCRDDRRPSARPRHPAGRRSPRQRS